jgi:3-oxoacyl-[acyl-carrier-protein] synthase II
MTRNRAALSGIAVSLPGGVDAAGLWQAADRPLDRTATMDADKNDLLARLVAQALDDAGTDGPAPRLLLCGLSALDGESASASFQSPPAAGLRTPFGALPATVVSHACATGGFAVHLASRLIDRYPDRPVVVAGACLPDENEVLSLEAVGVVADGGVQPLDRARNGTAMGYGAVALVFEDADRLKAQGRRPHAVLSSSAALVGPGKSGSDQRAIEEVLRRTLAGTGRIDAVCAHATGTQAGDQAEVNALGTHLSGQKGQGIGVYSNKGAFGHLMYTSALISAAQAAQALHRQTLPATPGCTDPLDTAGPLFVGTRQSPLELRRILVDAFGFGGNYASFALEHPDLSEES